MRRATVEGAASDPELATRLALAEAELRAMKDMLAEVRQSRDDWKAQAERLALSPPPQRRLRLPPISGGLGGDAW